MSQTACSAKKNEKGMTLIEVIVALMILLLTAMAMISTSLMSIQTNMINALRNEAVNVAEARMIEIKNKPFPTGLVTNDLTATMGPADDVSIQRNMRAASVSFRITRTVVDINADTKQVNIRVDWSYKNKPYSHSITTIVRRS